MSGAPAQMNPLGELLRHGGRIFPVVANGKEPAVKGWQKTATNNKYDLRAYRQDLPGCNFGASTGEREGGGAWIVVDIDVKNGKDGNAAIKQLAEEGRELPPTFTVMTPSGGKHLYFTAPQAVKSGANVLGAGVDIRSKGGLVVAPGSTINGSDYRITDPRDPAPAPQWLIERCGRPQERSEANKAPVPGVDPGAATERARHYLQHEAPPAIEGMGGDETAYKVAARAKDFGLSEPDALQLMVDLWNPRCSPPWNYDDLARKVANAYEYGKERQGIAAPETVFPIVTEAEQTAPAKAQPARRLTARAFRDTRPELDLVALIDEVLPLGGLALMYAKPSEGKTFLALDMGMAIARGITWHDRATEPGAVLLVAAEGRVSNRLEAYRKHHGLGDSDVPFFTIEDSVDLFRPKADIEPLIAEALATAKRAGKPLRLIILDTLACILSGGDENSGQDVGALLANVRRLQRAAGAAVLILHHLGKDASRGARGHSSLDAAIDAGLEVEAGVITVRKQRDGERGQRFGFHLAAVSIGINGKGKDVKSCVVVPMAANAAQAFSAQQVKPGSVAAHAQAVLGDISLTAEGKPVSLAAWREEFVTRHYPGKRKPGTNAFGRAQAALVRANRVSIEGDHATLHD